MDVQQQQCNYPSPFRSKRELQHPFYGGWTRPRSEDETPIPPKPTKKRTFSKSSADAPPIHPRKLPPIRSAAPRDVLQRAPSLHSVPPPLLSTLPEPRLSRPVGFKDLLNPISGDKISASGRHHDGEGTDSPRTAPIAAMSRLPTLSLPSTSMNKHSFGDLTLPSNALAFTYPYPLATVEVRQSFFGLPRDEASALIGSGPLLPSETALPAPRTPSAPPPQSSPRLRQMNPCGPNPSTSPRMQTPFDRLGNLTSDTASTIPQLEFAEETLDAPTSGASSQSQYQMMTLETEQNLIQIPVDVQSASQVADKRRKRNAIASYNFRRRRKEKNQATSDKISQLEAQVEYYQRERDFLQGVLQENHIPIPSRSHRRGEEDLSVGRTVEPRPPMLLPSEHIQVPRQRACSQGLYNNPQQHVL